MKIVEQTESKLVLEGGFGFIASTTHTFDKTAGKYLTKSKGLIGGGSETEHKLSEFTGVKLEEMSQSGEDRVNSRVFRLALLKPDGKTFPLTKEYTGNLKAHEKLVEAIKPFLTQNV